MINKLLLVFICSFIFIDTVFGQSAKLPYLFTPPAFGNGDEALFHYFHERINLKARDFKYEVQGTSNIKFKLSKDNKMSDFVVLDSTNSVQFNREILDYLKMSYRQWKAATINGKPIDVNIIVSSKLANAGGSKLYYYLMTGFNFMRDPLLVNEYYNLGSEMATSGNYEVAIRYFDEVVNFTSLDIDALYNRGVCYMKTGNKLKACEDWFKIKSSGRADADKLIAKYCGE